jgi:hypothetical protein
MDKKKIAVQVIESLRKGLPPQRGVDLYAVGNEKLTEGIKRFHLSGIGGQGIIRFISGSWGSGKTHFFRLFREVAFQNDCLVSNVELNANDAALNKFQLIFYAIVGNIITPTYYAGDANPEAAPFGTVVRESLAYLATGSRTISNEISHEHYSKATEALMADHSIDIDFKKMLQEYWKTFLPEAPEPAIQEQTRQEILAWFRGEGMVGQYRKRFGVNKVVNAQNAKLMLQSLAGFVRLSGYKGLVILFDEAEMTYSILRKSALKDAHNNLLSLINNIESLSGLFLVYATTPEFYTHPKYGIVIYGALAGRIGKPESKPPRALDVVWNLDAVEPTLPDYQNAARKIRCVYADAYPEAVASLPPDDQVDKFVTELHAVHPSLSHVRFWRALMTGLIAHFDDHMEGQVRPTQELYDNVIQRLRED